MQQVGIKIVTSDLLKAKTKIESLLSALGKIEKRSKNVDVSSNNRLTSILKKIETAVFIVADNVITNLYSSTHQGDINSLMAGMSGNGTRSQSSYFRYYQRRQEDLGLPVDVGYHAGSYRYSESLTVQFRPVINSIDDLQLDLKMAIGSEYNIGDTFYVMGIGPALGIIESGQYGDQEGILKPTIDSVMRTYKSELSAAYTKI